MSRIRTVKPELFRHEELFEAEKKYQLPLRLAFIGLFTCCDRDGRFRWKPKQLKLDILPYDEVDMQAVLEALVASGFIAQYQVSGEFYGCIPSWKKHQHINIREPASALPEIVLERTLSVTGNNLVGEKTCVHVQSHAQQILPQESHNPNDLIVDALSNENIPQHADYPKEFSFPTDDYQHLSTCPVLLPESSGACTCMHMGKRKGSGKGTGMGRGTEMEKEEEKQKELSANRNIVAQARRRSAASFDLQIVFDFWKTIFQHPQAILDQKRQRLIRRALQSGYTTAQLCDAISGCSQTPHNLGNNEQGQRYDGLHIILRDSDQIERFIRNHHNPPRPLNAADKLMQANVDAATNWLTKKNLSGDKP